MARTLTMQDISWFLDANEKGQLNLDPPYQRRSVWSPRDKRFFIDTILNNYPAPPIFLHKTLDESGRPTYHVADGKQRLQTIIEFTEDKIRIPDDFSDVTLQKKRWRDLEREPRERFWNYVIIVEMLPDVSDATIRNIFERINRNSRKLVPQEMRHAKYDGWFINTAEAEAEKQEWKDFGVVTPARAKRMADTQFISELFGVIVKNKLLGFDQDALDDLYAEFEELSEIEMFVEDDFITDVERIKSIIRELLAQNPTLKEQFKVQNHFYSLWGYLAIEKHQLLPTEEFIPKYVAFLEDVANEMATPSFRPDSAYRQAVLEYVTNMRGASTDLTPRTKRHAALVAAIYGQETAANENC